MIAAMAVAFSSSAMAQEGNREFRRMDPLEMAKHRTDMMAERYGFNDEQKTKLLELNTKFAESMPMPMRPGGPENRMRQPQTDNKEGAVQGQRNNNAPEARADQRERRGLGRGPGHGGPRFDPEKMKEYEAGLKEIMTPEQFQKYEADKQERMQRRPRPQN